MTIHFGTGWLIGILAAVYVIGVIFINLFLEVAYMDGEPPWWVRCMPLLWPVLLPLAGGYILVRILLMPLWRE